MGWSVIISMSNTRAGKLGWFFESLITSKGWVAIANPKDHALVYSFDKYENGKFSGKFLLSNALTKIERVSLPETHDTDGEVYIEGVNAINDGHHTKDTLRLLKNPVLKEILKEKHAVASGRKEELVTRVYNIFSKQEFTDEELKLKGHILNEVKGTESELHKIYGTDFNSEDIFDRYLSKYMPCFRTRSWRTKVTLTLIYILLGNAINIYWIDNKIDAKNYFPFLEEIAKHFSNETHQNKPY